MKRKVTHDAAKTNNQTPTESMPKDEFEAQYAGGEDMSRGANRNSKKDGKENENKQAGKTVPIPSDILKEEFGHEQGDINAYKVIELLEEAKKEKKMGEATTFFPSCCTTCMTKSASSSC